jgi:methanogenic corrinoid protein MtbC1
VRDAASLAIAERCDEIARAVVEAQFRRWPDLYARYGEAGRAKCVADLRFHVLYLAEAVGADSPALFSAYAGWVKVLFAGLRIPVEELGDSLTILRDVVAETVGGVAAERAAVCVAAALDALPTVATDPPSFIAADSPHGELASAYLDALVAGDRRSAARLVMERVDGGGLDVRDAYLHVFQPVLREIGRLWQTGRIGVAHEHFATAATQAVMSMLYPRIFATARTGRSLVATCVSGELHEIGVRMVADFFEMAGWDTYYLGASTPARAVVAAVAERNAQVLAVSATITAHVGAVAELIATVRQGIGARPLRIIVGGYPFSVEPDLWRAVGADGSASDAAEAVAVATRLTGEGP